ncbi:hypothetical protein BGZ83_008642 [Gryganskiella cystojenkinii]|nr:hypothetical protein BGZ83_008642 [Gryganskiella cystojenkinii]
MKAYLQILSAGTADCPPSVVLHFDSQRYLINCGEGTQRLCMESRMRFAKLRTVLLTRTHWDVMGGLPGMMLTLSDVGVQNMKVLGAENLTHALVSTRPFVYRNNMAVETLEFRDQEDKNSYQDENLRITSVHVYPVNYQRDEKPYQWPASYKPPYSHSGNGSPSSSRHNGSNMASPVDSPVPAAAAATSAEMAISSLEEAESESTGRVGTKRNSDEISSSPSTPLISEEPLFKDDNEMRKAMLNNMFNLSRKGLQLATPSKKAKREADDGKNKKKNNGSSNSNDDCNTAMSAAATEGLTDVDLIEQQAQTEAANHCGGPRPPNTRFMDLPRTTPNNVALSYIFQSPDYIGKFNKQAAVELGVKPGRLFGELMKGNTVVSEKTGATVYPHQVVQGARPGRVFMVIDCPTVDYIESLVESKAFEQFYSTTAEDGSSTTAAACIVHFGDQTILSHPRYKTWMSRFGSETRHIIANQDYCAQPLIWRAQSYGCYKLSKLNKSIFPIPYYDNKPVARLDSALKEGVKATVASGMLKFQIEPTTELQHDEVQGYQSYTDDYTSMRDDKKQYMREYYSVAEQVIQEAEVELAKLRDFPGKDVVLTSLGTGSSIPSKYRNVSATLLDTITHGTFFLDIGEGTFGQMFRHFGGYRRSPDQTNCVEDRIKNLKGIFISHLHADHHLGTVSIIDRWNKLRTPDTDPLYLIAPLKFNSFLQELSDVQDFGYQHVRFIESEDIVHWRDPFRNKLRQQADKVLRELLKTSGFEEIKTVDVIHCPWAYGISMKHKEGWKIVYSGDTRPCQNLVSAGQDATVLLHEATFEEEMRDEALKKKHSTVNEAIMVGEGMDAKFTMLTHFSQRYPKIPRFDSEDKQTVIGICFDLMSVTFGQMAVLPKYLPALKCLYSEQSDEAKDGEEESKDGELKNLTSHE